MNFNTLSAIMRGHWFIHPAFVEQHLPLIAGILQGKMNGADLFKGNAENEKPFVTKNGQRFEMFAWEYDSKQGWLQVLNESAWPDNSAGVIPTMGPIMKYNGDCGEPGMIQRTNWATSFANSPKIAKLVSWIDSPGGQGDGTPQYGDFLKSIDKPKSAYVDGGAYSAGAWVASAHDEIVMGNPYSAFGSIGCYCTFLDYSGYLKKMGFKQKDVYAEQSTEKNDYWRKALAGDMTGYQQAANDGAALFIDQFGNNRSGKLKSNAWNTGKVFTAQEALDMGLVDSIGSFADATTPSKSKVHSVQHSNPKKDTMKFENLTALAAEAEVTDELLDKANAELTTANITNVTLVRESFIADASQISEELTTTKTQLEEQRTAATLAASALTTAETSLATANETITANATEIAGLKAQVEAFGKQGSARHGAAPGAKDDAPEGGDNAMAAIDNLPHNKKADEMGYGK